MTSDPENERERWAELARQWTEAQARHMQRVLNNGFTSIGFHDLPTSELTREVCDRLGYNTPDLELRAQLEAERRTAYGLSPLEPAPPIPLEERIQAAVDRALEADQAEHLPTIILDFEDPPQGWSFGAPGASGCVDPGCGVVLWPVGLVSCGQAYQHARTGEVRVLLCQACGS